MNPDIERLAKDGGFPGAHWLDGLMNDCLAGAEAALKRFEQDEKRSQQFIAKHLEWAKNAQEQVDDIRSKFPRMEGKG